MVKPWYTSKIFWLGVIVTVQGILPLIDELVKQAAVTPSAIISLITGVLIVVVRVWFTNPPIELTKPFGIGDDAPITQGVYIRRDVTAAKSEWIKPSVVALLGVLGVLAVFGPLAQYKDWLLMIASLIAVVAGAFGITLTPVVPAIIAKIQSRFGDM